MASTYSPALRLELMATGDQSGTWGDTTNTNLGTLLEQAITGYLSVAQGDVANLTLTTTNGASDQARNAVVRVTGALTATRNVVIQTANKVYTIANDTTGGFSIVVKTSGGTGVSVPPGAMMNIYSDGTNAVMGQNYWNGSIGGAVYLDAGATVGPVYDLFRDSASPTTSDILGRVTWNGRDGAGNKQEYASIETVIGDATSTSEDGALDFYVTKAGARTKFASMTATGTAFTGAAAYSMDAPLTVSSTASGIVGAFVSTDAGANEGPDIDLYRNSATPAASDFLAGILASGKDSAGNKTQYGRLLWQITDPTNGSEDGGLYLQVASAGVENTTYLAIDGAVQSVLFPLGQLQFPSTQNPSSNVYTLDDVRRGTFTPGMTFGGSSTGVTYGAQSGTYIKIGRLVWVFITITLTSNGSGSGAARITGLPFTPDADSGLPFFYWFSTSAVVGNPVGYVLSGSTTVDLYMSGATGAATMSETNITDTAQITLSGTYYANA